MDSSEEDTTCGCLCRLMRYIGDGCPVIKQENDVERGPSDSNVIQVTQPKKQDAYMESELGHPGSFEAKSAPVKVQNDKSKTEIGHLDSNEAEVTHLREQNTHLASENAQLRADLFKTQKELNNDKIRTSHIYEHHPPERSKFQTSVDCHPRNEHRGQAYSDTRRGNVYNSSQDYAVHGQYKHAYAGVQHTGQKKQDVDANLPRDYRVSKAGESYPSQKHESTFNRSQQEYTALSEQHRHAIAKVQSMEDQRKRYENEMSNQQKNLQRKLDQRDDELYKARQKIQELENKRSSDIESIDKGESQTHTYRGFYQTQPENKLVHQREKTTTNAQRHADEAKQLEKIMDLQKKLETSEITREGLQNKVRENQDEIERIKHQYQHKLKQTEDEKERLVRKQKQAEEELCMSQQKVTILDQNLRALQNRSSDGNIISDLQKKFEMSESDRMHLHQKLKQAEEETGLLNRNLRETEEDLHQVRQELNKERSSVNALREKEGMLNRELRNKKEAFEDQKRDLKSTEERVARLEGEKRKIEEEFSTAQEKHNELEKSMHGLRQELGAAKTLENRLTEDLRVANSKFQRNADKSKSKEDTISSMERELEAARSVNFQQKEQVRRTTEALQQIEIELREKEETNQNHARTMVILTQDLETAKSETRKTLEEKSVQDKKSREVQHRLENAFTEVERLKAELERIQGECTYGQQRLLSLKTELQETQDGKKEALKQNSKLTTDLNEQMAIYRRKEQTFENDLRNLKENLNTVLYERNNIDTENRRNKKNITDLEGRISRQDQSLGDANAEIRLQKKKVAELEGLLRESGRKLGNANSEIELLNTKIVEREGSVADLHNQLQRAQASLLLSENQKKLQEHELYNIKEDSKAKEDRARLQIASLQEQVSEQGTTIHHRDAEISQLSGELSSLEANLQVRDAHVQELERAVEELTPKRVTVPVYMAKGSGEFGSVCDRFMNQLTALLAQTTMVDLKVLLWQDRPAAPQHPLVVFCINTSRLGTDVDSALTLTEAKSSTRTLLVVLHHCPKHKSRVTASARLLDSKLLERNRVLKVVDGAFWSDSGFYECDQNEKAIQEIADCIPRA